MAKEYISTNNLTGKNVLLIITGGVSAYKSLELIRLLKKDGINTPAILTKGGEQFITPLSVSALSEQPVYTDLFSLKDEQEMGHIRLSRENDLIVVVPASANMIARTSHGLADDLASTVLLAADKNIMMFPAMNPQMWSNAATQDNINILKSRDIDVVNPDVGEVACGEYGAGRLPNVEEIHRAILEKLGAKQPGPLSDKKVIITAGPTYEAIDPVRYIANRSSGKQGYAIAEAYKDAGAEVHLISGPTQLAPPQGVKFHAIESADQMKLCVEKLIPADIAVCSAAVCDWKIKDKHDQKIKKRDDRSTPCIEFEENTDILKYLSNHETLRPECVVGFAAETENVERAAQEKLVRKGCNLLLANKVGGEDCSFGSETNQIYFVDDVSRHGENWPEQSKDDVAKMLVNKTIMYLENKETVTHTDQTIIKLEAAK